jgi:hypothetical protein
MMFPRSTSLRSTMRRVPSSVDERPCPTLNSWFCARHSHAVLSRDLGGFGSVCA